MSSTHSSRSIGSIRHLRTATLVAFVSLIASPTLYAQSAQPETAGSVETAEQATAQRERATLIRERADVALASEQAACYKKILVNSCLDDARTRHTRSIVEARELDTAARAFERETRRAEINAKAAERESKIAERAARQARKTANPGSNSTAD